MDGEAVDIEKTPAVKEVVHNLPFSLHQTAGGHIKEQGFLKSCLMIVL